MGSACDDPCAVASPSAPIPARTAVEPRPGHRSLGCENSLHGIADEETVTRSKAQLQAQIRPGVAAAVKAHTAPAQVHAPGKAGFARQHRGQGQVAALP